MAGKVEDMIRMAPAVTHYSHGKWDMSLLSSVKLKNRSHPSDTGSFETYGAYLI
jgi:hypothetical protein